ncbi:Set3C deacetylase complex subunit [Komagataella phaffii CBS 7435]|uniref:Subunit of the Set3C deacetylase complex that interacts directly with the Set3C subunit n=2 Tax=Komagataella phaffii TaxID=460519 RepID=C4R511_KOMPG|nr:Subunit of the Set3C deacetylase complex that interacts directly with the Set3C subunit [Komagataella phaffii GS115]AOA63627.1 GQ67_03676T0 [Komagataella phaffii]CAH2449584.1 Set3C deacetylase complex subunit [Komagataella phaffii CBS 7435]AOA68970.1 GQ68_03648T0 [Komagataella phaffii GS115]CAY70647.1 Subunit of the Set3C deacetylase complex that interacts directly with the Set3C subunit [Komagataella phaffii GS115]CCA39563.1 Set3C deacetylase complex subunit [Komagataella phaffii CBS 7435]
MPPLDSNRGNNNPPRDYRRKYESEPVSSNGPRKHSGSSYVERDSHGYHRGSGSNGYYPSKKDFRPTSNGSSQGYSGYNNGYYGSYNNRYREPLPERRSIGESYKPRSNDRIPKDSRYRQQPMIRDYRDSRPYWNNRAGSTERISSSVPSSSRYYNEDSGYGALKKPQSSYAERNNRSSDSPSYGAYSGKLNTLTNKNLESPISSEVSTPRLSTRPSFASASELETKEESKVTRKEAIKEEQEKTVIPTTEEETEKPSLEKVRSTEHANEKSPVSKAVEEPVKMDEKAEIDNPILEQVKLEVNPDVKPDIPQTDTTKEDQLIKPSEHICQKTLDQIDITQPTDTTSAQTETLQPKVDSITSELKIDIKIDNTNINKEPETQPETLYRIPKIEGCIFPMNKLEDKFWSLQTRPKAKVLEHQWYLNDKKIENFTEYPFYIDNLLLHINVLSPTIEKFLQIKDKSVLKKRARLTEEFFSRARQWRQRRHKMDEQLNKLHSKEAAPPIQREEEPDTSRELKPSRRSRHGDFVGTEAEFQEILESLEREKEKDPLYVAQKGAAVIPEMILDPIERETLRFINTNNLITDKDRWAQRIKTDPIDTFTEKEHEMFVEAYIHHPKKFGRISAALGGLRTPEECVLHYYRTKKTKTNFKQVLASRKKGRGKPPRRNKVVLEKKAKTFQEDSDVKLTPEPMKRKRISSSASLNGSEVKKPRGNRAQEQTTTSEELQRKKPHLSSYWSVQEVKMFKVLFGEHGEKWDTISSIMKSKSSTMVKNFYQKKMREDTKKDDEYQTVTDNLETIENTKTPDQVEITTPKVESPENETPTYDLPHISTFYTGNVDQKKQVQEAEETIPHSKVPSIMNLLND